VLSHVGAESGEVFPCYRVAVGRQPFQNIRQIDDIVEHPYVKGLLTEMEGPAKANVSATDVERAVSYHFGGVVNAKIMSHRMKRRASNPTLSSSSS